VAQIPEDVTSAWQQKNTPAVLSTVDDEGIPNVIYSAFISLYGEDAFAITDHFFNKTRDNILRGCKGAVLFLSEDGKSSYQLKGTFEYHEDGEIYEQIRDSMPPQLPSRAVAILRVEDVYSGGKRL
jgi:predicted pyridoxine 5'-phosphate oxidase superfamily flavin-nucleotide-binding protein